MRSRIHITGVFLRFFLTNPQDDKGKRNKKSRKNTFRSLEHKTRKIQIQEKSAANINTVGVKALNNVSHV